MGCYDLGSSGTGNFSDYTELSSTGRLGTGRSNLLQPFFKRDEVHEGGLLPIGDDWDISPL